MKLKNQIILGISGIVVLAGIIFGIWCITTNISTDNKEVELRAAITAKVSDQEATFDNMWKILSQKAQVTDQYKEAFKEIYPALISGRYSQGDGTLMKWIQESNPSFDVSLYKDLMNSIEIERNAFLTVQRQLIDLKREHDNLLRQWPSKWFINDGVKEIEIKIISSTRSKEAMKSGKDDEVDLFNTKK